ncbi:MAG TPA: hypothetical protein VLN59_05150 [Burkholderiales bacterium]|nr:hypothetical protein [Burkholderiales bacterium]
MLVGERRPFLSRLAHVATKSDRSPETMKGALLTAASRPVVDRLLQHNFGLAARDLKWRGIVRASYDLTTLWLYAGAAGIPTRAARIRDGSAFKVFESAFDPELKQTLLRDTVIPVDMALQEVWVRQRERLHPRTVIAGRAGSGKSVATWQLLQKTTHDTGVVTIAPTIGTDDEQALRSILARMQRTFVIVVEQLEETAERHVLDRVLTWPAMSRNNIIATYDTAESSRIEAAYPYLAGWGAWDRIVLDNAGSGFLTEIAMRCREALPVRLPPPTFHSDFGEWTIPHRYTDDQIAEAIPRVMDWCPTPRGVIAGFTAFGPAPKGALTTRTIPDHLPWQARFNRLLREGRTDETLLIVLIALLRINKIALERSTVETVFCTIYQRTSTDFQIALQRLAQDRWIDLTWDRIATDNCRINPLGLIAELPEVLTSIGRSITSGEIPGSLARQLRERLKRGLRTMTPRNRRRQKAME